MYLLINETTCLEAMWTVGGGGIDGRFYAAATFLVTSVKRIHMARTEVRTNPSWQLILGWQQ